MSSDPKNINVWDFVHDRLSGSNYQQWKLQMEDLIKKTGMVGYIDGTTKAPDRKAIVDGREIETKKYKSWKTENDIVRKWIRDTITDDVKKEVKHVWTAKGLWTRFENWYGTPGNGTSSPVAVAVSAPTTASDPAVSAPAPTAVSAPAAAAVSTPTPTAASDPAVSAPAPTAVSAPAAAVSTPTPTAASDSAVSAAAPTAVSASAAAAVSTPTPTAAPTLAAVSAPAAAAAAVVSAPAASAPTAPYSFALPLHKSTIKGNWDEASKFIERESDAVRAGITEYSETALIVAVKSKKRNDFVKKLLDKMSAEDVALGDTRKRTALHKAAAVDNMEIAKQLVEKNPCLPNAQTLDKRIPLFFAATHGHRNMVLYLLSITRDESRPMSSTTFLSELLSANGFFPRPENQNLKERDYRTKMGIDEFRWNHTPFDGEPGFRILHQLTINGFYDIALALLQDKPQMAHYIPAKQNDIDFHSLLALARKPSSFLSGKPSSFLSRTSFNWFQGFIFWGFPVKLEKNADHQSTGDIENPAGGADVPLWKHIEKERRLHDQAHNLVKFLCNEIANSNHSNAIKIFQPALFQATSLGIVEIVGEILRSYPDAIYLQNQKKQSIFHQAIVCRREKVFNLICQVEESRTIFLSQLDESKNNALHLAGYMAPQQQLYHRAGATLQMQRELDWFKEVKKHVVPRSKEQRNDKEMTPAEVFIDTHKDLVKEAERWMKDTANACTIVAVLIATVAFAAAITVPGGNNSDGIPNFYKQAFFIIFGISDAFAFFFSLTSVLFFMSIHTCHYGEHDFVVNLPKILTMGLHALFLCILSTVIAFGATLHLVFGERYKPWIIIPIFAYACMPVASFVSLNFPLLADMRKSTKGSIFVKQGHDMLY